MSTFSDFMPFDANEYRAVVNPTGLVQQTWGYGRRLVLVPGELKDPRRAPVQFVKTRIARKAVKNRRRFLQLWTVEKGMRLINMARQLQDFPAAYKKMTGNSGTSAGEIMLEAETRKKLRRNLIHEIGVPDDAMNNWTITDMRAVIKDNTLLADVDEVTGRPRLDGGTQVEQGTVFEAMERAQQPAPVDNFTKELFHEEEPVRPSSESRVGELGEEGDFYVPEVLGDDVQLPEDVAAQSTLAYDIKSGGTVEGGVSTYKAPTQTYKGLTAAPQVAEVDPKDLEEPLPEPAPLQEAPAVSDQDQKQALRSQLESLGGSWHPRSGIPKLQGQIDEKIATSITAVASS